MRADICSSGSGQHHTPRVSKSSLTSGRAASQHSHTSSDLLRKQTAVSAPPTGWKSSVIGSLRAAGWEKPRWARGGCLGQMVVMGQGLNGSSPLRERQHILYRTLPEHPLQTS
ncbi:hypothetical protein Q8A67_019055 [Cirrhinus molitorella]|uniref:Uncharacterized protein n=1 Tax=Cirrhinus molitorella TaxID=172907 RepID=A0AA88P6I2_9TELE|nr:hypothetical protein Q8A67_019055 [Cirrhinus molitorella]